MQLTAIWRYPVKSMAGETLSTALVTELGVDGDRAFGVRDRSTGMVLTGRREPRLLLYRASLHGGRLCVTAPDGAVFDGDLASLSAHLSLALEHPVDVVRADGDGDDADGGGTYEAPVDSVNEADWTAWTGPGGAWHDSARTRVSVLSGPVLERAGFDPRRFRANLVISGDEPTVETMVAVGDETVLRVTKRIDRCVMIGRAQPGIDADRSVVTTVIRDHGNLMGAGTLVAQPGRITVGDTVTFGQRV